MCFVNNTKQNVRCEHNVILRRERIHEEEKKKIAQIKIKCDCELIDWFFFKSLSHYNINKWV